MLSSDRRYHTAKVVNASRVLLLTRACTLTGKRITFILPLTRTVRGHRYVSRSQKTEGWVSALVIDMASEPQEVCGAATLGHLHVQSSQDTLSIANNAGIHQAEKNRKKPLRGYLCLLTTWGLISVRPCRCYSRAPPGKSEGRRSRAAWNTVRMLTSSSLTT